MTALQSIDQVKIQRDDSTVIFSHPNVDKTLGPLYIHSGANSIKWAYTLNTQSYPTIGGEVTQILSAFVGPMAITGMTAGLATNQANQLPLDRHKGYVGGTVGSGFGRIQQRSYTPNHELAAIVKWFGLYLEWAGTTTRGNSLRNEAAISFTYPNRGWTFDIQVTALQGFRYDKAVISPAWAIEAEIISDNARNFFKGITMGSFTDDLITNYDVGAKIGLSAFANSGTESASNFAFGNTGDALSHDAFLNPLLNTQTIQQVATTMGDSFEQLLGSLAMGNFTDFAFSTLADNNVNIDPGWQTLFGSNPTSLTGSGTTGSTVYKVDSSEAVDQQWITDVLAGLKVKKTPQNVAFFYAWWQAEGGSGISGAPGVNQANYNWLNTSQDEPGAVSAGTSQGSIKSYPNEATGVQAILDTLADNDGKYADIITALKSGDPGNPAPLEGLGYWDPLSDHSSNLTYAQKVMSLYGTAVAGTAPNGTSAGSGAGSGTGSSQAQNTDGAGVINQMGIVAYHGSQTPVRVVVHDTEGATDVRGLAQYFANAVYPNDPDESHNLGCHVAISQDGTTYRLAPDNVITWHVANHNTGSLGVEMGAPVGAAAGWTNANWAQYPAQYAATVAQVARWCKAYNIPVTADVNNGISTHKMQSDAYDPGGHFDPGAGFPFDQFLVDVQSAVDGNPQGHE